MFDHYGQDPRRSMRGWIAGLDSTKQLGLGCLGILITGMLSLYCAGTFSVIIRPFIFQLAPTPILSQATLPPLPTATPTTVVLPLPSGSIPRTPTQGRIPTRETITPTLDPSISPTLTMSATLGTPRASATATKSTATPTRR